MLTGGNLNPVPTGSLLANVQLLRLFHLQHRSVRRSSTHGTSGATPRRNTIASTIRLLSGSGTTGSTWTSGSARSDTSSTSNVVSTRGSSPSRTGTPRWNVSRAVGTSVIGKASAGRRSVWRVLLLLAGFVEGTRAGSWHFLTGSGDAHTRWHPAHLRLEIEFVLRGVEFLLDHVRTGERRHVAFVELRWDTSRTVGVVRGVHVVLTGTELAELGVGWSLGVLLRSPRREAHAHGVFVLVLFGHVFEGLCRRRELRHGTVLGVPVGSSFRWEAIVSEGTRELVRYGAAPLDTHVVQHSGTGVFLLYAGFLLHLDLLLLLGV